LTTVDLWTGGVSNLHPGGRGVATCRHKRCFEATPTPEWSSSSARHEIIRPMLSSSTRFAPLRRILTAAEPEIMVQLVRLVVLYEDLKLEAAGLQVPPDKEFDEVSRRYRQMYFVRRAFATLLEMDNAFRRLNQLPEFKKRKKTFDRRRLKIWV